jgi:hypothetical protein
MTTGNLFAKVPQPLADEAVEELLSAPNVRIERIVSMVMRQRQMSGVTRVGPSGYSSFPGQPDCFSKATPNRIRLCPAAMFTFRPIGVIGLHGLTDRRPPSGSRFTINETEGHPGPDLSRFIRGGFGGPLAYREVLRHWANSKSRHSWQMAPA